MSARRVRARARSGKSNDVLATFQDVIWTWLLAPAAVMVNIIIYSGSNRS